MNYPMYDNPINEAGQRVAEISAWLDKHNGHKHPEAVTWGRLSKVAEEHGEAISEYIKLTGQNPRKMDQPGSASALVKEELDIALTALGNVEHLIGNGGHSLSMLLEHIAATYKRAGLEQDPDGPKDAVRAAFDAAEARHGKQVS